MQASNTARLILNTTKRTKLITRQPISVTRCTKRNILFIDIIRGKSLLGKGKAWLDVRTIPLGVHSSVGWRHWRWRSRGMDGPFHSEVHVRTYWTEWTFATPAWMNEWMNEDWTSHNLPFYAQFGNHCLYLGDWYHLRSDPLYNIWYSNVNHLYKWGKELDQEHCLVEPHGEVSCYWIQIHWLLPSVFCLSDMNE